MYNFILQTIFLLSLGTIIYLVALAVPRVSENNLTPDSLSDRLERLLKKIPLEKADAAISYWIERFLRKLKIAVLKLDNLLTKHLQSLKPSSGAAAEKPSLFEKKEDSEVK